MHFSSVKVDYTDMTDHPPIPDYELVDMQELTTPSQIKAVGDATRQNILGLLGERAATTSQLAEMLQQPKGTVGHHIHVLAKAGLIQVVRTRQVRAITEKYYGRVARRWRIAVPGEVDDVVRAMVEQSLAERLPVLDDPATGTVLVHGRMSVADAKAFIERIRGVAAEFAQRATPDEAAFGFLASVYSTDWPKLESRSGVDRDDTRE